MTGDELIIYYPDGGKFLRPVELSNYAETGFVPIWIMTLSLILNSTYYNGELLAAVRSPIFLEHYPVFTE